MLNSSTLSSSALDCPQSSFALRAEQELASFHHAVAALYGSEEANRAAADWLSAFESAPSQPDSLSWRRITQAASSRLASRLSERPSGALGRIRQLVKKHAGHTPCLCGAR